MKYDFSFLGSGQSKLNKLLVDIEKIIELIEYENDYENAIRMLRQYCQLYVTLIATRENIKLANNLGYDINTLNSKKILNDEVYLKLNFIESEFMRLESSKDYTISREIANRCLDCTYEFVKYCFNSGEKDKELDYQNKEIIHKGVIFTFDDLNFFDDHLEIKKSLYQGKKSIECDKNDLGYSPDNSMTNARKVIEHIVINIQDKFSIKTEDNLSAKIDSIEALMNRAIFSKIAVFRFDGNDRTHTDEIGKFSDDESRAINCLNISYEVSKWYIDFIKKPKDMVKSKVLHKQWRKNGYIEGTYDGNVLINKRDGKGTMYYANHDIYEGDWKDDKKYGNGILKYDNGDKYEGEWEEDKKHGEGIEILKNGVVLKGKWDKGLKTGVFTRIEKNNDIYEGEYSKDIPIGEWKLINKQGDIFECEFKNNKFVTKKIVKGKLDLTEWNNEGKYEGYIENGKRHGKGKMEYQDGSIYEGEFKDDIRDGQGILIYNDGSRFEGCWILGKKNGIFKIVTCDNLTYIGELKNDECVGIWKLIKPDGKKVDVIRKEGKFIEVVKEESKSYNMIQTYKGKWQEEGSYIGEVLNGKRHGRGMLIYRDRSIYEGEFKDDKKDGQGKFIYTKVSRFDYYEGEFKEGNRDGQGKLIYKNGSIYEGQFKDDKKDGQGKLIHKDGSIYEGCWIRGKKNGMFKIITSDNLIYKSEFKDDTYIGECKDIKMNGRNIDIIRKFGKFIENKNKNSIFKFSKLEKLN